MPPLHRVRIFSAHNCLTLRPLREVVGEHVLGLALGVRPAGEHHQPGVPGVEGAAPEAARGLRAGL